MRSKIVQEAYETVMGYVPDDAKQVLAKEIPRIEKTVDDELTDFSKELALHIETEMTAVVSEVKKNTEQQRLKIEARLEDLSTLTAADTSSLQTIVEELRDQMDGYDKMWRTLGKKTRDAIVTAARGAGIPVPDLSSLDEKEPDTSDEPDPA